MNPTITRLALQALAGRRRFWVLLALPALLVGLVVLVRVLTDDSSAGWSVVTSLGVPLVLPLVAILAASAVLGPEMDDGSVVYLLSKPVDRHVVAVSKYVVAWLAAVALGAVPLLVAGLVADPGDPGRALAWLAGGAAAATAYTALFLALASVTRFAVVIGLLFALLWEGLLGGLLSGVAWLSIAQWGTRIAAALSDAVAEPAVGLPWALLACAVVTVGGVWFTGDRLRSYSLRGED